MREFRFNWRPLIVDIVLGIVIAVTYFFVRGVANAALFIVAAAVVIAYRSLLHISIASSVTLASDRIVVRYLAPWRSKVEMPYERIKSYSPIRVPKRPQSGVLFGVLSPSEGKPLTLFPQAIIGFNELNRILEASLPKPAPNKAPEPTPGAVTPRATEGASK